MLNTCITCNTKLIPIVYGRIDPEILELQNRGLLLIGMKGSDRPNSFCPLCEEAYGDYTLPPADIIK